MGDPAIVRNSDYWKLYAKDPNIREGAQQRFGVRPQGSEGGIPTTTGHVASKGGFNSRVLDRLDITLNGQNHSPAFSGGGSVTSNLFETSVTSPVNPATQVAGGGSVTSNPFETSATALVNPATQVASGGNQNFQKKLANIGTGELTPTCDAKHQWFA